MTEYSCFWWECCACDANADCATCQFRISPNLDSKEYYDLYREYENKVDKLLEPLRREYQDYFSFYKKGVISQ